MNTELEEEQPEVSGRSKVGFSEKSRPVLRNVAVLLATGAIGVYMLSALLLAGPTTPLKFQFQGLVSTYMLPHFSQNWNLFAPDPINEERGVIVRAQCSDKSDVPFADITTPIVEDLQASRFFPSRESRIISNGILERFREDEVLTTLQRDDRGREDIDAVTGELSEAQTQMQQDAEAVLAQFAAHEIAASCPSGVEKVQLRYVFHAFPGWSGRHDVTTQGEVTYLDSEWITVR